MRIKRDRLRRSKRFVQVCAHVPWNDSRIITIRAVAILIDRENVCAKVSGRAREEGKRIKK